MDSSLKDPWFAVKVRTGAELRIGDSLEKKEFKIFVPTCIEPRPYSDRIKKVRVALFPGYVFSRFGAADKLKLLVTPGVEAVVSTAGVPDPIDEQEIGAIIKVVAATKPTPRAVPASPAVPTPPTTTTPASWRSSCPSPSSTPSRSSSATASATNPPPDPPSRPAPSLASPR